MFDGVHAVKVENVSEIERFLRLLFIKKVFKFRFIPSALQKPESASGFKLALQKLAGRVCHAVFLLDLAHTVGYV